MKKTLIFLNVVLLLLSLFQSNHDQEEEHVDDPSQAIKEVEVVEIIAPPVIQKKEADENTLLSKELRETLGENQIVNLDKPIPIPQKWLNDIQRFKNQTLPDTLGKFLEEFDCAKLTGTDFDYVDVNLDEDVDQEKILFFYFDCSMASSGITLWLNQNQNNWVIETIASHMSRKSLDEMKPEFIPEGQMVVCKSGYWGSGAGGGINHFYKKINGKWHEVLSHINSSFLSFPVISHTFDAYYQIMSEEEIAITFKFNYFQQRFDPEEIINILVDRKKTVNLNWDADQNEFVTANPLEKALLMDLDAREFPELYKNELKQMSQYGTPKQQEVLSQFDFSGDRIKLN